MAERAGAAPKPPAATVALPRHRRRWLGWSLAAALPLLLVGAAMLTTGVRKSENVPAVYAQRNVDEKEQPLSARGLRALPTASAPSVLDPGRADRPFNTDSYDKYEDNPFIRVAVDPLSTFSIDVDTASYSNVRGSCSRSPAAAAGRGADRGAGELLLATTIPARSTDEPFAVSTEVAGCPWAHGHRLVRIGLKAKDIDMAASASVATWCS